MVVVVVGCVCVCGGVCGCVGLKKPDDQSMQAGRLATGHGMHLRIHLLPAAYLLAVPRSTPHRVLGTACIYFRKFYLRGNDFSTHDPRSMALACLFLAAKAEEVREREGGGRGVDAPALHMLTHTASRAA